jgi:hypothetical protein
VSAVLCRRVARDVGDFGRFPLGPENVFQGLGLFAQAQLVEELALAGETFC